MEKNKVLLKNSKCITKFGDVCKPKDILIQNGQISKIAEFIDGQSDESIDCSNYYVTPGLVNLHTHSGMNIFKGLGEDVCIERWFNDCIWPYESKMTKEDTYYGSMLAIYEMIDNGVTAFADHYFNADMILKAVRETGIRIDLAVTIFGQSGNFDEQIELASDLIKKENGTSDLINVRMGPHSPYTCTPAQLKKINERARELNVGSHIHVSETEDQIKDSIKAHGMTPFQLLKEIGAFDIPTIIAHGLWITEEEIDLINENLHFASCPKTYMKLAVGYKNIWKHYKRLPLCIGTDGVVSSNTLDPIEQARLFAMIGKFNEGHAEDFTLKEMWQILMRGHDALTFGTGDIKEGAPADLLIWDLNEINTMPAYNPLAAILYSANSKNVIYSMVAGSFLKKQGKVQMEKEKLIQKVKILSNELLKRGKGKTELTF